MVQEGARAWAVRLWAVSALQEGVESWAWAWLSGLLPGGKGRPFPSRDYIPARRAAPPFMARFAVVSLAMAASFLVVGAPRILFRRPKGRFLLWATRNTPPRVIYLSLAAAVLQVILDGWISGFLMPGLIPTAASSFASFFLSVLLMTGVLLVLLLLQEVRGQPLGP